MGKIASGGGHCICVEVPGLMDFESNEGCCLQESARPPASQLGKGEWLVVQPMWCPQDVAKWVGGVVVALNGNDVLAITPCEINDYVGARGGCGRWKVQNVESGTVHDDCACPCGQGVMNPGCAQ